MKHFFIITFLTIALLPYSCQQCKKDKEFETFYFNKVKKIVDYDELWMKKGIVSTDDWMEFYSVTDYLSRLTKCNFQFAYGEPPMYKSDSDMFLDVHYLKEWYDNNKCGMSIKKADSIVAETFKKKH